MVHDGRANTYTVKNEGKRIVLKPLSPKQVNDDYRRMRELIEVAKAKAPMEIEPETNNFIAMQVESESYSNENERQKNERSERVTGGNPREEKREDVRSDVSGLSPRTTNAIQEITQTTIKIKLQSQEHQEQRISNLNV